MGRSVLSVPRPRGESALSPGPMALLGVWGMNTAVCVSSQGVLGAIWRAIGRDERCRLAAHSLWYKAPPACRLLGHGAPMRSSGRRCASALAASFVSFERSAAPLRKPWPKRHRFIART